MIIGAFYMSWNNFQNRTCEFYPCHNVDPEKFNCWGCYCPLYPYPDCGGNYKILSEIKNCSECLIPHSNPDLVLKKLAEKIYMERSHEK